MIESEYKIQVKTSKIQEEFDFNDLITKVLVREPPLLYFVCRRGSRLHQNNRGKKHPPLDPRGIINYSEIDSKFFAKFQFNNNKKDSHLVSVKPRKKWDKPMHNMPTKHCKPTKMGKRPYRHLKRNGMAQYIEDNYSLGNCNNFTNNFAAMFNLKLPEGD